MHLGLTLGAFLGGRRPAPFKLGSSGFVVLVPEEPDLLRSRTKNVVLPLLGLVVKRFRLKEVACPVHSSIDLPILRADPLLKRFYILFDNPAGPSLVILLKPLVQVKFNYTLEFGPVQQAALKRNFLVVRFLELITDE